MANFVIAGLGQVGYNIAQALAREGHNITVVEKEEKVIEESGGIDGLVIQGNAASPSVLDEAYISSADYFISVTGSDEINMVSASIAKSRGARTIARINSLDYMDEPETTEKFNEIGIDVAICPELVAAIQMSNLIRASSILDATIFAEGRVHVLDVRVTDRSLVKGKAIKDIAFPRDCNIGAIFRDADIIIPHGKDKFLDSDRVLIILGNMTVIDQIQKLFGYHHKSVNGRKRIDRVMIYGATRIGVHLADMLRQRGVSVVLLDEDEARCRYVSERLPKLLVIQGSGSDRDTLAQEGIKEVDAFLATTAKEESNILSCLLAKQIGVNNAIALVDRLELKNILEDIGMDLVVSPRRVTVSTILKYTHGQDFISLDVMNRGEAQVVEIRASKKSKLIGKKLMDIKEFKKHALVGSVVRRGKVVVPRGQFAIQPNDHLIIFTKSNMINKLDRLLRKG
jgi:trk system potassium uptake protein TrkA